MNRIIITDLTRFSNRDILCTAGVEADTGNCIRPMPYLEAEMCRNLSVLPGSILTGDFSIPQNVEAPHVENMDYNNLEFNGQCSSTEFRGVLSDNAFDNIEDGFKVKLDERQKHITIEAKPVRSLITISIEPDSIHIVQDGFKNTKIKAHITDNSDKEYRFLPITDLGFQSYAENHHEEAGKYEELNDLLHNQEEVFLRIGLSHFHEAPNGKAGYWIQVNGIYSFPDYFETARQYE